MLSSNGICTRTQTWVTHTKITKIDKSDTYIHLYEKNQRFSYVMFIAMIATMSAMMGVMVIDSHD